MAYVLRHKGIIPVFHRAEGRIKVYKCEEEARLASQNRVFKKLNVPMDIEPISVLDHLTLWHDREESRDCPDDRRMPSFFPTIYEHFCRRSHTPGFISFIKNNRDGMLEVRTAIKPGRYLKKYFGDQYEDSEIESLVKRFTTVDVNFELTKKPGRIRLAYESGPQSCMSYTADHWGFPIHPAELYGSEKSNLCVATVWKDGRCVARTLVFPERKLFCHKVYGDRVRMVTELTNHGYKESKEFMGATIPVYRHGKGRLILPYPDYGFYFYWNLETDILTSVPEGKHNIRYSSGGTCLSAVFKVMRCILCSQKSIGSDGLHAKTYVNGEVATIEVCHDCYTNRTAMCGITDVRWVSEHMIKVGNSQYSKTITYGGEELFIECVKCNEWFNSLDLTIHQYRTRECYNCAEDH